MAYPNPNGPRKPMTAAFFTPQLARPTANVMAQRQAQPAQQYHFAVPAPAFAPQIASPFANLFVAQSGHVMVAPLMVPVASAASAPAIAAAAAVVPAQDWDGAVTIIIEAKYRYPTGGRDDTILLFFDGTNYSLTFGGRDPHHRSSKHTANAETAEKSCNMFRFGAHHLQDQFAVIRGKNIAYPICINSSATICRAIYDQNQALLASQHCPRGYRETSGMTRVAISTILASGFSNRVTDVYGSVITIEGRSMGFIEQMIRSDFHTELLKNPITLTAVQDTGASFSRGTIYHH
jgi:hypothetical protein